MCLVWMPTYPTYQALSQQFQMCLASCHETIMTMLNLLHATIAEEVTWHLPDRWRQLQGIYRHMSSVVGSMNCTPLRISRPLGDDRVTIVGIESIISLTHWWWQTRVDISHTYDVVALVGTLTQQATTILECHT